MLMTVIVVLFGGVLALFGDSAESNAYTPVSAEVDAYTPLIQLYAQKYGIPDYVDLIKAIMMTESGSKGSDPMQSSESGYNTRYPRKPKAIQAPEHSIDVGVQTIADVLKKPKWKARWIWSESSWHFRVIILVTAISIGRWINTEAIPKQTPLNFLR